MALLGVADRISSGLIVFVLHVDDVLGLGAGPCHAAGKADFHGKAMSAGVVIFQIPENDIALLNASQVPARVDVGIGAAVRSRVEKHDRPVIPLTHGLKMQQRQLDWSCVHSVRRKADSMSRLEGEWSGSQAVQPANGSYICKRLAWFLSSYVVNGS